MRVVECQTVRFFVVFFPDILFQQMVFVVGLGFVAWISWDLWTSNTVGWWLIHDKKTPSLNIFGMVQLPTKYFNIQLLKGEGFKSATIRWRKKPTQETGRKTHWDKPLTKRNLDFFFDKMAIPMSLIYWRWCWHHTKYASKTVGQKFLLAVMLFCPEHEKKPPRRLRIGTSCWESSILPLGFWGENSGKEWSCSNVFSPKKISWIGSHPGFNRGKWSFRVWGFKKKM